MRIFHLPGFFKTGTPETSTGTSTSKTTTGTGDFALARMRFSLVAWFVMGLIFLLFIAPRLLGIT